MNNARKGPALKFTKDDVLKAIHNSNGVKTVIAQRLKCSRVTLDKYLKRFKKLQDAFTAERETADDFVESQLMKLIEEGNPTAIIFYCKTRLKDRGYSERLQIEAHQEQIPQVIDDVSNVNTNTIGFQIPAPPEEEVEVVEPEKKEGTK